MEDQRHCSIVIADIEGSSALSGPAKRVVRKELYRILDAALQASGIAPASRSEEDRGDGVYVLVDSGTPIRNLMDPFIAEMDRGLAARAVGDQQLRLRLVVHQGEVAFDEKGSMGQAVDRAFAMLDAPEAKEALAMVPAGRMAVVVADDTYQQAVRGHPKPGWTMFRKQRLTAKGRKVRAWIMVTGIDDQPVPRRTVTPRPKAQPSAGTMNIDDHSVSVGQAYGSQVVGQAMGDVTNNGRHRSGGRSDVP